MLPYGSAEEVDPSIELQALHRQEYNYLPLKHTTGDLIPIGEDDDLMVIPAIHFSGELAFTNHVPEPWERFTLHHASPARASSNSNGG